MFIWLSGKIETKKRIQFELNKKKVVETKKRLKKDAKTREKEIKLIKKDLKTVKNAKWKYTNKGRKEYLTSIKIVLQVFLR